MTVAVIVMGLVTLVTILAFLSQSTEYAELSTKYGDLRADYKHALHIIGEIGLDDNGEDRNGDDG